MTEKTEAEITSAALAMSPEARSRLAARLTHSLQKADKREGAYANEFERRRNAPPEEVIRFWEKLRNPELDRVGDSLLENHSAMREETIDRGEPL